MIWRMGKDDKKGAKPTFHQLVIIEQYRMCPSTHESLGCLTDDLLGSIGCESQREAGSI